MDEKGTTQKDTQDSRRTAVEECGDKDQHRQQQTNACECFLALELLL